MKKKCGRPKSELARLPNGEKVRIESREGNMVTVRRIVPGIRLHTLAVCALKKLKRF